MGDCLSKPSDSDPYKLVTRLYSSLARGQPGGAPRAVGNGLAGGSQAGLPPSERVDDKSISVKEAEPVAASVAMPSNGDPAKPAGPALVPVRVFRDELELGVKLGTDEVGGLQFTVTDTVEEAQETAGAFQASYQAQGDAKSLENLKLLLSMGIEVRYCSSNPFIAKLALRFLSVSETNHAKSTYVKVHLEDDRTLPLYVEGSSEGDSAEFSPSPLIFVVVHSDAVATIKVRDKKDGAQFYGQTKLAVRDIPPGISVQELVMMDPKDPTKKAAVLKVQVTYEYMRGTEDEGSYLSPSRVRINKRKLGTLAGLGAATNLVNHISQQNHWLLSHDNVWPPSSTFLEAEEQRRREREADSAEAAAESANLQGPARALITHTESGLRGNSLADRYLQAVQDARRNTNGEQNAAAVMNEGILLEALGPKEGEAEELSDFKKQMLALLLALHERVERTEAIQEQQNLALQELLKETQAGKTAKDTGASLDLRKAEPFISGTFEYGVGRPAASRKVYLFINKAQDQQNLHDAMVQFLGVYKTNKKGQLNGIPVPESVWATPGHYSVVAFLPEDHTYAKGSLFILAPGTKCIVFDMDGTITIGDIGVVTQFAIDSLAVSTAAAQNLSHKYDIKARHSALTCVRAWAAKGYQPIYVSGRQGSYYNLTMEWLVKHHYPPGPIHLTRSHLPTLPIYYSVGNFKVEYMEGLKAKGLELFAAYGNTTTDIRAYVASGIPLERIYIIGPHGGKGGSVKIDNFTHHIPDIFKFPDANPPIPYTELLFTAVPGYKRGKKLPTAKRPEGTQRSDSTASSVFYPPSMMSSEALSSQDLDDALDDDIDEDYEAEAEAQAAEGNTPVARLTAAV